MFNSGSWDIGTDAGLLMRVVTAAALLMMLLENQCIEITPADLHLPSEVNI